MPDLTCPVCGRENPAAAEVCAFCGARLQPAEPVIPPPSDETDWLASLISGNPAPGADAPLDPQSDAETEDWLSRIRRRQKEEIGEQDQPVFDLPDWLQPESPALSASAPAAPDLPAAEDNQTQEDADWLKSLSDWQAADVPPAATPEAQPPAPSTEFDWASFQTVQPSDDPADTADLPELNQPSAEDQPDWLAQLSATVPPPGQPAESTPVEELPAQTSAARPDTYADLPDWMNLGAPSAVQQPEVPTESQAEESAEALRPGELPDWMAQFSPAAPVPSLPEPDQDNPPPALDMAQSQPDVPLSLAAETSAVVPPPAETLLEPAQPELEPPLDISAVETPLSLSGAELPDWLANEPSAADASPAVESEPAVQELEKANLPGWLQAMRPVEDAVSPAAMPSADEQRVVAAGPLRGLAGALPAEDLVLRYRKPPVYSARLHVSERQRQYAAMLEELLPAESQPQAVRPARRRVPKQLVRLAVALVLLLTVLYPLVTGQRLMPTPGLYPPELVAFNTALSALPVNAPILLAVDYEPGLSGEMRQVAAPVVDQLITRQARMAVVSTVPTGPVLAEMLLNSAAVDHPEYSLTENAVNLGFLAGGTTGLQEFAHRPQMARPYTLDGFPAWSQPALAGVSALQSFSAVVVLTESAETARAWIEQVQPALGAVPMLLVVSAQSAPMVQPYVESGQVQGMVSGYAGGVMYAQITRQTLKGIAFWDAYQMGIFLAIVLILIGGVARLFGWLASLQARGRKG